MLVQIFSHVRLLTNADGICDVSRPSTAMHEGIRFLVHLAVVALADPG